MSVFRPEENTAICMYGPPEYFESLTDEENSVPTELTEEPSFFEKIVQAIKKLLDFIKGLFKTN